MNGNTQHTLDRYKYNLWKMGILATYQPWSHFESVLFPSFVFWRKTSRPALVQGWNTCMICVNTTQLQTKTTTQNVIWEGEHFTPSIAFVRKKLLQIAAILEDCDTSVSGHKDFSKLFSFNFELQSCYNDNAHCLFLSSYWNRSHC